MDKREGLIMFGRRELFAGMMFCVLCFNSSVGAEEKKPPKGVIIPVPIKFMFPKAHDKNGKEITPNYVKTEITLRIDDKIISGPVDIDFGVSNKVFGRHFRVEVGLKNIINVTQIIYWDGLYDSVDGKEVLMPSPGVKINAELKFFAANGGQVVAIPEHTITIYFEYQLIVKVNGQEIREKTGANKTARLTSDLGYFKLKDDIIGPDDGFYVLTLDKDEKPVPGKIIYVKTDMLRNNVMNKRHSFLKGLYQVTSYAAIYDVVQDEKTKVDKISIITGVISKNRVIVDAREGYEVAIALSLKEDDYYRIGSKVTVWVDNEFRGGPERLRQFPERATLLAQVRIVKGRDDKNRLILGEVVKDFNGTVEVREEGKLFGQVPYSTPLNLPKGVQIQINNGEGTMPLWWVATAADQKKKTNSSLVARFVGEDNWSKNPLGDKDMPKADWTDVISLGGGTNLTGTITKGGNGVPDWLDALMLTTRRVVAAGGTDAAKIVNGFSTFNKVEGGNYVMKAETRPDGSSFLTVNSLANVLRPCANFQPMFEGASFKKTKTPYGNSFSHELRHAYVNLMALKPGNDPDQDGLPTAFLPNDVTKRVAFPFNGVPNCDVLDLNPNVPDVKEGAPSETKNEPFGVLQDWTLIPGSQNKLPLYQCVFAVKDKTKTPIIENRAFAFTLTLKNGLKYIFDIIGQDHKFSNTDAIIYLDAFEPNKGEVRIIIRLNPGDIPNTQAILLLLKNAELAGDYLYPAKWDGQSRLEWDAHKFAENEEPEDNK